MPRCVCTGGRADGASEKKKVVRLTAAAAAYVRLLAWLASTRPSPVSYGLYGYGRCSDGLFSYGRYSYNLCSYGLYSHSNTTKNKKCCVGEISPFLGKGHGPQDQWAWAQDLNGPGLESQNRPKSNPAQGPNGPKWAWWGSGPTNF